MNAVFVDTSFYAALLNEKDRWRKRAIEVVASSEAPFVTSDYILVELGALFSRGKSRERFVSLVTALREDSSTTIVHASRQYFDSGLDLFRSRPDKEWSLTDCISFAIMRERGISEALTCDHHFAQAGFRVMLNA